MNRAPITGNAGSGKSTLARLIVDLLGLPCRNLDQVVWQRSFHVTPKADLARLLPALGNKGSGTAAKPPLLGNMRSWKLSPINL